jgi:hypothetical protein
VLSPIPSHSEVVFVSLLLLLLFLCLFKFSSGLPDFSFFQKTKTGKNIPNFHELYQMSIEYNNRQNNGPSVNKFCQHLPLQDPPKCTQIWIFWFENKPSGNPGFQFVFLFSLSDSVVAINERQLFRRLIMLMKRKLSLRCMHMTFMLRRTIKCTKIATLCQSFLLPRALSKLLLSGLPDDIFSNQEILIWVNFGGTCNGRCTPIL